MKPSEVPDTPVAAVLKEANDACVDMGSWEARRVIAAVWPEIEKRVRERVAAEIEETIDADVPGDYEAGLQRAARIARGESR